MWPGYLAVYVPMPEGCRYICPQVSLYFLCPYGWTPVALGTCLGSLVGVSVGSMNSSMTLPFVHE